VNLHNVKRMDRERCKAKLIFAMHQEGLVRETDFEKD